MINIYLLHNQEIPPNNSIIIKKEPDFHLINWHQRLKDFGISDGDSCKCPCEEYHTTKTASDHFKYYLNDPKPNGFRLIGWNCFHTSCGDNLKNHMSKVNKKWYKFIVDNNGKKLSDVEVIIDLEELKSKKIKEEQEKKEQEEQTKKIIELIKSNITPLKTPLSPIFDHPEEDMIYHLKMFNIGDIIFNGSFNHSKGHLFELGKDKLNNPPYEFISSFTFIRTQGILDVDDKWHHRASLNCKEKPYGVLELDNGITKEEQLQLLLAIEKTLNIQLLMAVDSGGKSVHGWFHQSELEDNLDIFKAMKYDMKTLMSRSQPVRFAGAFRKDKQKYQRIIYKCD